MTKKVGIIAAVVALLVICAGAALGVLMSRDGVVGKVDRDAAAVARDADAASADLTRQDQPIYYAFDPPVIVNIKDTDALMQVGLSVSTHFASVNEALKSDDPALRSAILLALADAPQDMAMSDAGKEQLLARIVPALNAQLRKDGFTAGVEQAYFTSFIVQADTGEDAQ